MTKGDAAAKLKKEIGATVEVHTRYVAISADGLVQASGNTELEALELLKAALAARQ